MLGVRHHRGPFKRVFSGCGARCLGTLHVSKPLGRPTALPAFVLASPLVSAWTVRQRKFPLRLVTTHHGHHPGVHFYLPRFGNLPRLRHVGRPVDTPQSSPVPRLVETLWRSKLATMVGCTCVCERYVCKSPPPPCLDCCLNHTTLSLKHELAIILSPWRISSDSTNRKVQ